ncbi:MAG: iron-sulfur cluster repair di-iron protein [Desulfuromonadales bacterium]
MTTKTTTPEQNRLEQTIGDLVAEDYRNAAVFEKHGIDFCCGGQVTLGNAARDKGLDPDDLLRELKAAKETATGGHENYTAWDLAFLADYIVNTHHSWLNDHLGQIAAYAHKIAEVHGEHHPEVIRIATLFDGIAADMVEHLREEEEIFFPAIKRIEAAHQAGTAPSTEDASLLQRTLETLHRDHEAIGEATHEIRRLAGDYTIPADVCNTFAVTYRLLKEFEDDLHKHVHLENNILFPKAAKLLPAA